jgi:hypothetical protein
MPIRARVWKMSMDCWPGSFPRSKRYMNSSLSPPSYFSFPCMGRGRVKTLSHLNQFVNMLRRIFQNQIGGEEKTGCVLII